MKPFENGVFSQDINQYDVLTFRRFINGCQTEESISINLRDESINYSNVKYRDGDFDHIENIAVRIADMAKKYSQKIPEPPSVNIEGKELYSFYVGGWYVKKDGKVYGIIKTTWIYREQVMIEDYQYPLWGYYYDDTYTVYDAESAIVREMSRKEILEEGLGGWRNVYAVEYDEPYIPAWL